MTKHRIIAGSYERRSIISATNIESGTWGTVFADDKLAAAIIDPIVHHGRLLESWARAAAPARLSCSAGTPPRNRKNKENACNCLNPKKIHD